MLWHVTAAIFPLKFTDCLERSKQTVNVRAIIDFKTARRCLTGSIILQCGLSAGKQKFSCSGVVCHIPLNEFRGLYAVELVFEGSIPRCSCFHSKLFCDFSWTCIGSLVVSKHHLFRLWRNILKYGSSSFPQMQFPWYHEYDTVIVLVISYLLLVILPSTWPLHTWTTKLQASCFTMGDVIS